MDMCLLIKGDVYWCKIKVAHLVQHKSRCFFQCKGEQIYCMGGGSNEGKAQALALLQRRGECPSLPRLPINKCEFWPKCLKGGNGLKLCASSTCKKLPYIMSGQTVCFVCLFFRHVGYFGRKMASV